MKKINSLLLSLVLAAGIMFGAAPFASQHAFAADDISASDVSAESDISASYDTGEDMSTIIVFIGYAQKKFTEGFADYLNGDDGIEGCSAEWSCDIRGYDPEDTWVILSYPAEGSTVGEVQKLLSDKLLAYMEEDEAIESIDYKLKLFDPALGQKKGLLEYSSEEDVYDEMESSTDALPEEQIYYSLFEKGVGTIKLKLKAPAPGTIVLVSLFGKQCPVPEVEMLVGDASFTNSEQDKNTVSVDKAFWSFGKSQRKFFGKISGSCTANIQVSANFGYFLALDSDEYNGIYVNGEQTQDEDYYSADSDYEKGFWYQMNKTDVRIDLGDGHEDLAEAWAEYLNAGNSGEEGNLENFGAAASGATVTIGLANSSRTLWDVQTDLADNLATYLGGDDYDEEWLMDGDELLYPYMLGLNPADGYTSFSDLYNELYNDDKIKLGKNQKLYAIWFDKPVSSIDLKITPPVAGETAGVPEEKVTSGAADLHEWNPDNWFDEDGKDFYGVFEAGKKYLADVFLEPKYGYYFAEDMTINVSGAEAAGELYVNPFLSERNCLAAAIESGGSESEDTEETAVGDTAIVNGSTYEVLSLPEGNSPGTVSLTAANNVKSISVPAEVTIDGSSYNVTQADAGAFKGNKIRRVTLGANIEKLCANAFRSSKVTKIIVKTTSLTKESVKGSLKGSKVRTVQVKVGNAAANREYVKEYRKIFTKANCGKMVIVRR